MSRYDKRIQQLEDAKGIGRKDVLLYCRYGDSEETREAIKRRHIAEHPEDTGTERYVFIVRFSGGGPVSPQSH